MTVLPELIATLDQVRQLVCGNLAGFDRAAATAPGLRCAAVTICILQHRGEPHLVMIKRVARGRNAGQWALPGGRLEDGENAVGAALRETQEEIAIEAAESDVLGVLDDFVTATGFVMTPVVVVTDRTGLRRNPGEVHSIHPIRLRRLLDPDLPRWRRQPAARPVLQMPLRRDMVVHPPTGAILWQFREVGLRGRLQRVADLSQPEFTHH